MTSGSIGVGRIVPGSAQENDLLAEIAQGAAERDANRTPAFDAVRAVAQAGLGALRVPVELGGHGMSLREQFEFIIRLSDADPNVSHILRTHYGFVEQRRRAVGPESETWLKKVADGAIFGNAVSELSSSAAGSRDYSTTLLPDGENYRLNGTKYYTTGTLYSDYVLVVAGDENGAVRSLVIPTDREGVSVVDDWDGIGQRLSGSGTTTFDNVLVHDDEVLRQNNVNSKVSQPGQIARFGFTQLYLSGVIAGIMQTVVRDAATVIRGRTRTFAQGSASSPGQDPLIQVMVGELKAAAYTAESLVLRAAEALDREDATVRDGVPDQAAADQASAEAAMVQVIIGDIALRSASHLFDVSGASATARSRGLDRHWRNIRTLASHNPPVYKARALGDSIVNGTSLPDRFF